MPDVTVTSATFNMYHFRSWAAGVSWTFQLAGRQASFNENTITWSNAGGITTGAVNIGPALSMPGGNGGDGKDVVPAQWRQVDLTSFFNANKGTTVTLVLKCTSTGTDQGGSIEDREGSRTGNAANGPYIEYVPEPATLALLAAGLGMAFRRKR